MMKSVMDIILLLVTEDEHEENLHRMLLMMLTRCEKVVKRERKDPLSSRREPERIFTEVLLLWKHTLHVR